MSIEPNLSALREQGSITYNSQCSERPPLLHIPNTGNLTVEPPSCGLKPDLSVCPSLGAAVTSRLNARDLSKGKRGTLRPAKTRQHPNTHTHTQRPREEEDD